MAAIPLTRVGWFIHITDALERLGTSPECLLRRLRMPMWHHCPPDQFVPLEHLYRLLDHGARSVGCGILGVEALAPIPIRDIVTIGPSIAATPTVYQALETAVRLVPTHGAAKRYWLVEGRDEVWFCRGGDDLFDGGERFVVQYALTFMVKVVRLGAGPDWRPAKISLQTSDGSDLLATETFANAQIWTDQAVSAIAIPRPVLSLPIGAGRQPATSENKAQTPSAWSGPATSFVESLREVIATLLPEGYPQIECAAEIAGVRTRTLQRMLASDGVTYRELVDQARFDAASRSLREPSTKITDIAFDLGYTDAAHFTRAFRRWAGTSPSGYRRDCLAT